MRPAAPVPCPFCATPLVPAQWVALAGERLPAEMDDGTEHYVLPTHPVGVPVRCPGSGQEVMP